MASIERRQTRFTQNETACKQGATKTLHSHKGTKHIRDHPRSLISHPTTAHYNHTNKPPHSGEPESGHWNLSPALGSVSDENPPPGNFVLYLHAARATKNQKIVFGCQRRRRLALETINVSSTNKSNNPSPLQPPSQASPGKPLSTEHQPWWTEPKVAVKAHHKRHKLWGKADTLQHARQLFVGKAFQRRLVETRNRYEEGGERSGTNFGTKQNEERGRGVKRLSKAKRPIIMATTSHETSHTSNRVKQT